MARGESGRIVLEIDPVQKNNLYSTLIKDGFTLKDWFLQQAEQYLHNRTRVPLFTTSVVSEDPARYKTKSTSIMTPSLKTKNHRKK